MILLTWKEVQKIHRTIAGIYVRDRLPISILVNRNKDGIYSDEVTDKEMIYVLNQNTQTIGINALLTIVGKPRSVRAFEKLNTNKWRDLGDWQAIDVIESATGQIRIRFLPKIQH